MALSEAYTTACVIHKTQSEDIKAERRLWRAGDRNDATFYSMGLKEIQWTPPPPRFISLIRRSADFFPPGAVAAACFNPFVNTPAMRKKFKFIPQLSGANATRG